MKRKLIAAFMAALFSACVFTACSAESGSDVKETKVKETETKETTENALEETTVGETTETEQELVETEPTIDLSQYQEGSFYDIENNELYGARFYSYKEKMAEIVAQHPDEEVYFCYGFGPYLYYNTDLYSSDEWPCYFWDDQTDEYILMDGEYGSRCQPFTYEDFLKLPRFVYTHCSGDLARIEDSVPDGEYCGTIVAVSTDASKVFMLVEEPVIISAEEFNSFTPGYHVSVIDSDPHYGFPKLDVSEHYDPSDPETMFDEYGLMFVEREQGDYMLVDTYKGEFCPGTGMNARLVYLDVDPECEIDDYCTPTYTDSYTPFGYVDGPTTFARSMLFWDISKESNAYAFDNWMTTRIIVKPCYIENNTIKSIRFEAKISDGAEEYRYLD